MMVNSDSGYTLIEVIIAIQIAMIIISFTYSIYLFGFRFISRWEDKTNLISQELLLRTAITKKIGNSKRITEISPSSITTLNSNHKTSILLWSEDSVYYNDIPLNKNTMRIFLSINSLYSITGKRFFNEIDQNRDEYLRGEELTRIKAIKFYYKITSKNSSCESSIIQEIPNHSDIFNTQY
jgi:hypothetical protein